MRRSTAASAIPTCRSGRSPIRTPASTAPAEACCSGPICSTAPTPTNSPRCRRPSGWPARSNSAPAFIRNTPTEFENGIAVAWHRMPFTLGCAGDWSEAARAAALRRSLPDRRQDRAGGRACLLHSGLAGGRHPVFPRRHHPAARARGEDVMQRGSVFSGKYPGHAVDPNLRAVLALTMTAVLSLLSFAASRRISLVSGIGVECGLQVC